MLQPEDKDAASGLQEKAQEGKEEAQTGEEGEEVLQEAGISGEGRGRGTGGGGEGGRGSDAGVAWWDGWRVVFPGGTFPRSGGPPTPGHILSAPGPYGDLVAHSAPQDCFRSTTSDTTPPPLDTPPPQGHTVPPRGFLEGISLRRNRRRVGPPSHSASLCQPPKKQKLRRFYSLTDSEFLLFRCWLYTAVQMLAIHRSYTLERFRLFATLNFYSQQEALGDAALPSFLEIKSEPEEEAVEGEGASVPSTASEGEGEESRAREGE